MQKRITGLALVLAFALGMPVYAQEEEAAEQEVAEVEQKARVGVVWLDHVRPFTPVWGKIVPAASASNRTNAVRCIIIQGKCRSMGRNTADGCRCISGGAER